MKTVRIFSDRIRDRIRLKGLRYVRIRVRIFNIRYRIRIRILKSHIYDVDIQSYLIRYGRHYPYSNPNLDKNMKTNVILVISVRIRSVFIPRHRWLRNRPLKIQYPTLFIENKPQLLTRSYVVFDKCKPKLFYKLTKMRSNRGGTKWLFINKERKRHPILVEKMTWTWVVGFMTTSLTQPVDLGSLTTILQVLFKMHVLTSAIGTFVIIVDKLHFSEGWSTDFHTLC